MEHNLEFWAFTFDLIGKLLVAATALMAHRVLIREKKIDKLVLKDLKLEVSTGVFGILFMILGYGLHILNMRN
jgi:hypothetical protein